MTRNLHVMPVVMKRVACNYSRETSVFVGIPFAYYMGEGRNGISNRECIYNYGKRAGVLDWKVV
jgi:hypothetical protein